MLKKISEYIKLLPRAIKDIDKVVEGFKNDLLLENNLLSEEDRDVIVGRRLICSQCPYNSVNAVKLGIYKTEREDPHCIHCGCNIKYKTAALNEDCGISVYNEEHQDNPMPLKWSKLYNK